MRHPAISTTFRLDGKRALVTGGAAGIGRGIALALAEAGSDVAILYRVNVSGAEEVAGEVRQMGRRALAVRGDVSDAGEVEVAISRVAEELGGLDIAVNNAGIVINAPAAEMSEDEWDRVIAVNLRGGVPVRTEGRPGDAGPRRWGLDHQRVVDVRPDCGLPAAAMRIQRVEGGSVAAHA